MIFWSDFGNCGYSVRPSERQKGYATEMLRQLLAVAKDAGLQEVHLATKQNNIFSVKTIQFGFTVSGFALFVTAASHSS